MEAWITTAVALMAIAASTKLLARWWPHSSRRTGFRIWAAPFGPDRANDGEPPVPEDDDLKWNWRPGSDRSSQTPGPPRGR